MATDWEIKGKKFLITGGASGIGAAYADAFLQHGAEKIAILDIAEKVGTEFTQKLNQIYSNKAVFIKCNVSKENEIQAAFEQVLETLGEIDVIINNAGVMNDAPDVWRTASDINWQGVVSVTMKGVEYMRTDKGGTGGTIINVSSIVALMKMPVSPMYSGSKAAVIHFGRCLASPVFNNDTGVRLLTICFGPTDTPLLSELGVKTFDTQISKKLWDCSPPVTPQRVQSAVEAVIKMYREGAPGSIWLSVHDKPGTDITNTIDAASNQIEQLLLTDDMTDASELYSNKK